jgi:hypothetical protein
MSGSGRFELSEDEHGIHHRGTENAELAQRLECFALCVLRVLCASVVNRLLHYF